MNKLPIFKAMVWKPNSKTNSMVITIPRWIVVSKKIKEGNKYEFEFKEEK